MKKIILFAVACFAIVISSCNQNSPAPAPASSAPTPTPTSNFTSADSAISGNWILDLTELYSLPSNTLTIAIPHNDPAVCHLNLMLITAYGNDYKQCISGLACPTAASSTAWRLVGGDLDVGGEIMIIESQTATNLVLRIPGSNTGYLKKYLHK